MEQRSNDVTLEIPNNICGKTKTLDISDESVFESMANSISDISFSKEDTVVAIAEGTRFNSTPAVEDKNKRKRKWHDEVEELAEEEYNKQIHDQRYKRLMHLLDRSQFYSNYLNKKFNGSLEESKSELPRKYKVQINDENIPLQKKSKKTIKEKEEYDIREYMTKDIKKKLDTNKQHKRLSQKEIMEDLMIDSDIEVNKTIKNKFITPEYFNGSLRNYQEEGFKWLKVLYEHGVNGILADEMGLGKTIQVISLLCHLIEKKQDGPYLIIAPLSTIPNWIMEFERFAPKIPVVLFHGNPEKRETLRKQVKQKMAVSGNYRTQPVVLTTFEVPIVEKNFFKTQKWRYIIIDEGHRIKNYKCQLVQVLKTFQSMNRLLLTGTPLQNDLSELWSLLNFLLPEIFNDLAVFESWFDAKELQNDGGVEKFLQQEERNHIMSSLREILKPFMLRRLKSDVCLDIPPKKELIVYAPLSELQHDLYKAVLNKDLQALSKLKDITILPDVNGKKAKRKCLARNKYSSEYTATFDGAYSDRLSSLSSSVDVDNDDDDDDDGQWKENKSIDENKMTIWKQYADVTERNRDFFINIKFGNRTLTYKKIVNHPYLIHCPLNPVGLPKIDEELIKSSGKLLVLDAMLEKLYSQGHKILLFSTMTMILDMIEDYLSMRKYQYVRLDGTSPIQERAKNIKKFNYDPNIFLFLISTRAGGVGLNLAGADTVIVYDSDWNPQADIQAIARCHRIGQTQPVVVYKLCTKGTVDETIINRAEAKRKLEKMVISKEALNMYSENTLLELKQLLDSKDYQVVTSAKEIFSTAELDKLLDRSDLISQKNPDIQQEIKYLTNKNDNSLKEFSNTESIFDATMS